jgi:hypothetical protein
MKRLIAFSVFVLLFFNEHHLYAQNWEPLEMHAGGKVTGIVGHPTNTNTIFARTDVAGIYKSTNNGDDWAQLLLNVPKYSDHIFKVRSFVINPNNANELLFASGNSPGGDHSGIWKSTDGGTTWELKSEIGAFSGNGSYRWVDEVMAYKPSATNTIYAGAQPKVVGGIAEKGGILVSNDSGDNWAKVNNTTFDDKWITKLIFDPDNDDMLYIAAANPNVTGISTSGGLWSYIISTNTLTQLTTNEVVDVDFDAVNKDIMLAVGPEGIITSYNKGVTWSAPASPFGYTYTSFVTPHPTEGNHWFFGGTQGFFSNGFVETDDALATTHFTSYGLPSSDNYDLITWPDYAAANTNTQPIFGGALSNFYFNPLDPTTAYFNNVWRCDNATGLLVDQADSNMRTNANWEWTFTAKGIYIMVGIRVSPHPTDEDRYTLNVADVNQYETFDNGGDLLYYGLMQRLNYSAVTKYFEGNDNIKFSGGVDHLGKGTLNKTTDGSTWIEISSDFFDGSAVIQDIHIDPVNSNRILVGLENSTLPSQIYRNDAGGINNADWYAWDTGIPAGHQFFKKWEAWSRLLQDSDDQTYYAWSNTKLFTRGINEATWQEITLPLALPIRRVTIARDTPGSLYVVYNQSNQLHVSKDYGENWTAYPLPYNSDSEFVSISPTGKRAIVARRHNFEFKRVFEVWINNDIENGGTWNSVPLTQHASLTKSMEFLNEERIVSISRGHGSFLIEIPDESLTTDDELSTGYKISPNPSSSLINIMLKDAFLGLDFEFQIIDVNGRIIKTIQKASEANTTLNVSQLSKGLYFVRLKFEDGNMFTSKFIKN